MKRIVSMILALALVLAYLTAMPVHVHAETVASGTCGENLTWVLTEDGTLTISGTGEMYDFTPENPNPWMSYQNEIKSVVIENGVTSISHGAFFEYWELQEVSIADSVTTIGYSAFAFTQLREVDLPDSLRVIPEALFSGCVYLRSVSIPNGVTEIENSAFHETALEKIELPLNLQRISEGAFASCSKLKEIVIPDGVTEILHGAFNNSGLTKVTIPASVTTLEDQSFAYCQQLKEVYYVGTTEQWNAIRRWGTWDEHSGSYKLYCLGGGTVAAGLEYDYINGQEAVVGIGSCTQTKIVIPTLVPYTRETPAQVTAIADYAFDGCVGITEVVIPEGITEIGETAFWGCTDLKAVTIPSSVRISRYAAFMDCTSLETVTLQEGAKLNGQRTFRNCTSLKEIKLPRSMSSVAMAMFAGCTNLSRVELPENLQSIGQFAFEGCNALTEFTIPENLQNLNPMAFNYCANLTSFRVAAGGSTKYRTDGNSILLGDTLVVGTKNSQIPTDGSVTRIGSCAFCGRDDLTQFTIPNGMKEIGMSAFSSCQDLAQVTIPASVEYIGDFAFSACSALKVIYYEGTREQFEQIQKYDWDSGCDYTLVCRGEKLGSEGLEFTLSEDGTYYIVTGIGSCTDKEIIIPYIYEGKPVKEIAPYAFSDKQQVVSVFRFRAASASAFTLDDITGIVIPDSVTMIGEGAFSGCDGMTAVSLGKGVSQIGVGAFENCPSLESLQVAEENETYHSSDNCIIQTESKTLVAGCKASQIPADGSVIDIGESAFAGCQGLTQLEIPQTIAGIGSNAFAGCENLETVTFKGNAPQLAENAFADVEAKVQYPAENDTWTEDVQKDYEGTLAWEAVDFIPANAVMLPSETFAAYDTVWIEGLPYAIQGQGDERYVVPPAQEVFYMVTYTYHAGDGQDVHTQYPTGMKVYKVSKGEITYIPELDDLLQYSGSSIRIVGKKGIRMITSLTKDNKKALTGKGLAGFKLLEYGTALCFASEIQEGDGLVLGRDFTRSNFAYKKGEADPVFASPGNLIQYTNVLVGFSLDQCKEDIAMRPYIILEDAQGNQVTLYGGTIYRSIGYIAYQNRSVFKPKTAAYNYVWELIHHVYGDKYDADFKG